MGSGARVWNGEHYFSTLIFGDWIAPTETFSFVNTTFPNLQNFFVPGGNEFSTSIADLPFQFVETEFGRIQLGTSESLLSIGTKLSDRLHSEDAAAATELDQMFRKIRDKFPQSPFMWKQRVDYCLHFGFRDPTDAIQAVRRVFGLAEMFAILTFQPTYPMSIRLHQQADDGTIKSFDVFPALYLEARTIDLANDRRSHFTMPITGKNIDLAKAIEQWFPQRRDFSTIVAALQHDTGFGTEHSLHGDILLYVSQLEEISRKRGMPYEKRYELAISDIANDRVLARLRMIFAAKDEADLGVAVGDLRNEIAHLGRPKPLLATLSIDELGRIAALLRCLVLSHVLISIGVSKPLTHAYQDWISLDA